MKTYEGNLVANGLRVAVLVARFNGFITDKLCEGALDALTRHGASESDIEVFRVPGAFELVGLAKRIATRGKHDAIVVLGALIRGGTPHFDYLSSSVTSALSAISADAPCAVAFGVLTCDTVEQAIERSGTKAGNKGFEAAVAAIEQANLLRQLK